MRTVRGLEIGWYVAGLAALGVAVGGVSATWWQVRGAYLIGSAPVRSTGTVESITSLGKDGERVDVGYAVGDRGFVTDGLDLHAVPDLKVGTELCLQAAASSPDVVRLCGETYPAGEDFPAYVLAAVVGVLGIGVVSGRYVIVQRERRPAAPGAGQ